MQLRILEAQAPITHVYFSRIINKSYSTPINIIIKNIVHGTHVMQGASRECTKHSILELSQPKRLHAEKITNREQAVWTTWTLFYSIWFSGLYHPLADYLTQPRCLLQREVDRALKVLSHLIVQANYSPSQYPAFYCGSFAFFLACLWRKGRKCDNTAICIQLSSSWKAFCGFFQPERKVLIVSCLYLKMTSLIGFYLQVLESTVVLEACGKDFCCAESLFAAPGNCSTTFPQACQGELAGVCYLHTTALCWRVS